VTSVVLADDQELVRSGFRLILELAEIDVVGEAAEGVEALEVCRRLEPDVVLMDVRMPTASRRPVASARPVCPRGCWC
jgi:YesN/AraC family two-component response regulator